MTAKLVDFRPVSFSHVHTLHLTSGIVATVVAHMLGLSTSYLSIHTLFMKLGLLKLTFGETEA